MDRSEPLIRTPVEVGQRIIVLWCVAHAGCDAPTDGRHARYLMGHNLWSFAFEDERTAMSWGSVEQALSARASWRVEALYYLLWSVRLLDAWPVDGEYARRAAVAHLLPNFDQSPWPFIRSVQLRPLRELVAGYNATILATADWPPKGLASDDPLLDQKVAARYERRNAALWLFFQASADWEFR